MSAPRVVRDYECIGGPLDGETRAAAPPPTHDRIYVVSKPQGEDLPPELVVCSQLPPGTVWTTLGYYEVREDENTRRGLRTRLRWKGMTNWPLWLNQTSWKPDPPKTDFSTDNDSD